MNSGKWLALSVALNLLVIGFIAGHFILGPSLHQPSAPLSEMVDAMPDHGRQLLQKAMSDIHAIHENNEQDVFEAREALAKAIEGQPFSPVELSRASENFRNASIAGMSKISARMKELVSDLSPSERKVFADHFRDMPVYPSAMRNAD